MKAALTIAVLLFSQTALAQTFDAGNLSSIIPENHRKLIAVSLSSLEEGNEMNWWGTSSGGELEIEKTGTFNGNKCATFKLSIWDSQNGFKNLVKHQTLTACFANGKWSVLF